MSGVIVSLVLDAAGAIAPHLILPLVALADRARSDSCQAWPSVADIAERTGRSERQARRDLRELESAGWITSQRGGGRAKTTVYTLNLERLRQAKKPGHPRQCLDQTNPDAHDRVSRPNKPGHQAHNTRTPMTVNPDIAMSPELLEPLYKATGVGVDVDLQSRAKEKQNPLRTPIEKNGNGKAPPRPARGPADEQGIEALARYFGKWPLIGEPGRSWEAAFPYVNRLREEHFRNAQAPAIAPAIARIVANVPTVKPPPQMSRDEQLAWINAQPKAKP